MAVLVSQADFCDTQYSQLAWDATVPLFLYLKKQTNKQKSPTQNKQTKQNQKQRYNSNKQQKNSPNELAPDLYVAWQTIQWNLNKDYQN